MQEYSLSPGRPRNRRKPIGRVTGRKRANEREAHLKQMLLAIWNVNQLITTEIDPGSLIDRACMILTETLGFDLAWIALTNETADRTVMTAFGGFNRGFETLGRQLGRGEFPFCMQQALGQNKVVVIEDPVTQCVECALADSYTGQPRLIRRMECRGRIFGVVAVCVPIPWAYDAEEQALFNELGGPGLWPEQDRTGQGTSQKRGSAG